jgi:LuxR family transcriptional regulator, quorum-sensing system regulator CinR
MRKLGRLMPLGTEGEVRHSLMSNLDGIHTPDRPLHDSDKSPTNGPAKAILADGVTATELGDETWLTEAYSITEKRAEVQTVVTELRDFLNIDHVVYFTSKFGGSPSADPYIRLTYPASWLARYLAMGYADIDPILREGFQRTLPFEWSELDRSSGAEAAFLADAAAHGVGPHGYSIPVSTKHGHRGLLAVSFSGREEEWTKFLAAMQSGLVQIANRLHRRVIADLFGEDRPHLTPRELECLRWIALGKGAGEIAAILEISPHTTRDYLKSVHYKLDCVTSAQAVTKAVKLGLLVV